MRPESGLLLIVCAGLSSGSFAVPSKSITGWRWDHVWLVYSFHAFGLLPLLLAALLAPRVLSEVLPADPARAAQLAGFGVLWGLGALLFGVSLPRLGIAVSNALVSGTTVLAGSLGPLLVGSVELSRGSLIHLMEGLAVLLAGVALCALSAIERDRRHAAEAKEPRRPITGVLLAILSGVLSSMLNVGFTYGAALSASAAALGYRPLAAALSVWVPLLLGGLLVNALYTGWKIHKHFGWRPYIEAGAWPGSWIKSVSMAFLWFGAIQLYGLGASLMGQGGTVYGWALIVGVSILASSVWGVVTGEWRGAPRRAQAGMAGGILLLLASFLLLAVFGAA